MKSRRSSATTVIRRLLVASRARVIFNSNATRDAFALPARQSQTVVYNGFAPPAPFAKPPFDGTRPLRLLCIGRLNAGKGQEVLIRACALLPNHLRDLVSVRIVGGVYANLQHFRRALEREIARNQLGAMIELHDFVDDPSEEYRSADIVVVPSTSPESFGRVAIEGMAYGCAVIASNRDGLREIVVDGKTGSACPSRRR